MSFSVTGLTPDLPPPKHCQCLSTDVPLTALFENSNDIKSTQVTNHMQYQHETRIALGNILKKQRAAKHRVKWKKLIYQSELVHPPSMFWPHRRRALLRLWCTSTATQGNSTGGLHQPVQCLHRQSSSVWSQTVTDLLKHPYLLLTALCLVVLDTLKEAGCHLPLKRDFAVAAAVGFLVFVSTLALSYHQYLPRSQNLKFISRIFSRLNIFVKQFESCPLYPATNILGILRLVDSQRACSDFGNNAIY